MPASAPQVRKVADVIEFLAALAPLDLAEPWDNVGLLWGDASVPVRRVMTCLTLTPDVAAEAQTRKAELVVSHHPILFRPVQRLTTGNHEGRMLLGLARNGIAVYSAHTAYDSAADGINRQLAESLGLHSIVPLRPKVGGRLDSNETSGFGSGRIGALETPCTLCEFVADAKSRLGLHFVDFVGLPEWSVQRVAIACGSAAEFIDDAILKDCQVLVTGEARLHACLEARDRGLGLVLLGHFASERPGMVQLAHQVANQFPDLEVWPSEAESDPVQRG